MEVVAAGVTRVLPMVGTGYRGGGGDHRGHGSPGGDGSRGRAGGCRSEKLAIFLTISLIH